MDTYEYLFNHTMQDLQDKKTMEQLRQETNAQTQRTSLELLQTNLQFLSDYGFSLELEFFGSNVYPYCCRLWVKFRGHQWRFCYSIKRGIYVDYDFDYTYTIDDIVKKIAGYYFRNK